MIADDLIAVRFLSKPYRSIINLRCGSPVLKPWLTKHRILYSERDNGLIFELPIKYDPFTYISDELADYLHKYSSIIIQELNKLDMQYRSTISNYSIPLSSSEIIRLYQITQKTYSFLKIRKYDV